MVPVEGTTRRWDPALTLWDPPSRSIVLIPSAVVALGTVRAAILGMLLLSATAFAPHPVRAEPSKSTVTVWYGKVVAESATPATATSANPNATRPVTTVRPIRRTSRARPTTLVVVRPTSPGGAGAVQTATAMLGRPYRYGASGPDSYDCSGLTAFAWGSVGVRLPHSSYTQWRNYPHVPLDTLQPGDLVFFNRAGHVGIYVGGGMMIHAPHRGDHVRYASIRGAIGATRPG